MTKLMVDLPGSDDMESILKNLACFAMTSATSQIDRAERLAAAYERLLSEANDMRSGKSRTPAGVFLAALDIERIEKERP